MRYLKTISLKKIYVLSLVVCAITIYIYFKIVSINSKVTVSDLPDNNDLQTNTKYNLTKIDIKKILSLKKQISEINRKQVIQNIEHFGYEIALVIVIQVHDQKYYLEQLLSSLEQSKGITKTLLIFSHSYCDREINTLIRNTTFAKVMQIFYPYSVQLHPYVFPGNNNKICRDLWKCRKGNRNPLKMQTKHHWWWKVTHVFDKLDITQNYPGPVLFLEEDQYVTKDLIYIMKVLERLMDTNYPHCDIISLGGNKLNISDYHLQDATVVLKPWTPREYIGIVFNRDVWDTMRQRSEDYCRYTDDRWINSLINIGKKTTLGNFYVLSIDSPRVLRFSSCINNDGTACNITQTVEHVQSFVKKIRRGFFPHNMIVREMNVAEKLEPNGGWSDARDHELCLFYTNKKI